MRTYITEEDIQQAREQMPLRWSQLSQDAYLRTYSRTKPDGRQEDWYETCARVVNGNLSFVDERFIEPEEAQRLYRMMLQMKVIPAGRHLWVTGALTDKVFLANCHCADFTAQFSDHFEYTFSRLMEGGGVGANYSARFVNSRQGSKPWIVQRRIRVHLLIRPDHKDMHRQLYLEPNDVLPEHFRLEDEQGRQYTTLAQLSSRKYSYEWTGNGSRIAASSKQHLQKQVQDVLNSLKPGDTGPYLQVEDSREGWATALVLLLESAVAPSGPDELDLIFDLSLIREFGAKLRTFGGTASGPGALALMLMRIAQVLNSRYGQPVTGMDAMLIDHYIACCVVAGGARRSARMAMKYWMDEDIFEFIHCKSPIEDGHGNRFNPHHTTNISVVVDNRFFRALRRGNEHAQQVLAAVIEGMMVNGEPGLINASKCLEGEAPGTDFYSTNPCVTEDTLIWTDEGIKSVAELTGRSFKVRVDDQYHTCRRGFIHMGVKPVFKLVTEWGTTLRATADHRLLVKTEEGEQWKRLDELKPGDQLIVRAYLPSESEPGFPFRLHQYRQFLAMMQIQGMESLLNDEYFAWFSNEQAVLDWKHRLNLVGIPVRISNRQRLNIWSMRVDSQILKRIQSLVTGYNASNRMSAGMVEWTEPVASVEPAGERPVFDCTVPEVHSYCSNGLVSHNCGEIAFVRYPDMQAFDVCNLGHVNLANIENEQEMLEAFRLITRFLIRATFAPQADQKMTASIERNRRIGVGFLGYHTWLALHGIRYSEAPESEFVRSSLKSWYNAVREEARRYCMQLRIPECIKVTAIAPTGTTGTMAGVSTGIQPVFAPFYIRRVVYNANDVQIATRFALDFMRSALNKLPPDQLHVLEQLIREVCTPEEQIDAQTIFGLSLLSTSDGKQLNADTVDWLSKATTQLSESPAAARKLVQLTQERGGFRITDEDEKYLQLYLEPHPHRENHYIASYLVVDHTARRVMERAVLSGEQASIDELRTLVQHLVESQYELEPRHFLSNQRMVQELFADNCISITINVDPSRISREQLKQQILEYLPHLKGITVMPVYTGADAPLQAVSAEEMQRLQALGLPVSGDMAPQEECAAGVCPIR